MEHEDDIDDILQTAYGYRGWGPFRHLQPNQHSGELREFITVADAIDPKSIVEIGSAHGGTLYVLCRYFDTAELISIDPKNELRSDFFEFFGGDRLQAIAGYSNETSIQELLANALSGNKIDILFIDGDHSYEGVKRDYQQYSPLMAENGIIAFHDITKRPEHAWFHNGVHQFWREVSPIYEKTKEIIHANPAEYTVSNSAKQQRIERYAGIGVLFK